MSATGKISRRWIAIGLSASLVIGGCSSDDAAAPRSTVAPEVSTGSPATDVVEPSSSAESTTVEPLPDDAVVDPTPAPSAELIAPFVAAGITVSSIDEPVPGPGVNFTDWQAANLIHQANAGNGVTGARLNESFPLPDDVVSVDFIVAAWLLTAESAPADAARSLMPGATEITDPTDVVFPWAVLALFVQDVAFGNGGIESPGTDDTAATSAPGPTRVEHSSAPARSLNVCSALLGFYDSAMSAIFDALGGKDSLLGQLAQQAIGLLPVPKPKFHVPQKNDMGIFQALGILISVAGALNPWTISVEPMPTDTIAYGVAPAFGNEGTLRTIVDPNGATKWPDALKSCAQLVGLELPDIDPVASIVRWDLTFGDHAKVIGQADQVITEIDGVYLADTRYETSIESAEQATGPVTSGLIVGQAKLERPGSQTFKSIVTKLVGQYLDPSGTIGALVVSIVSDAVGDLDELNSPSAAPVFITVTYHLRPDPTTTEPPPVDGSTPDPTTGCVGRDLYSQATTDWPAGIRLRLDPNGSLVFDFSASTPFSDGSAGVTVVIKMGGTLTGTWEGTATNITTKNTAVNIEAAGSVAGSTFNLPPEFFQSYGTAGENLLCTSDSQIIVERTGQVYG